MIEWVVIITDGRLSGLPCLTGATANFRLIRFYDMNNDTSLTNIYNMNNHCLRWTSDCENIPLKLAGPNANTGGEVSVFSTRLVTFVERGSPTVSILRPLTGTWEEL